MKIGKLTDDDIEFLGMSIRNYNYSMSIYEIEDYKFSLAVSIPALPKLRISLANFDLTLYLYRGLENPILFEM